MKEESFLSLEGIVYKEKFIENSTELFNKLESNVTWDERMSARKTASFGKAYNYSQISYPFLEFTEALKELIQKIEQTVGFEPNNCLINFYMNGKSKMGFHSDQTNILFEGTGVVIISLGETRTLRFRNIEDRSIVKDFELPSGSLIYMKNEVQDKWQHAIPKSNTENGRMSLTFRKIKD